MNTGCVQRIDFDNTGKKLKKVLFRASDVETSDEAIRKICGYIAPANDKLNIEKIVTQLEQKLNFCFNQGCFGRDWISFKEKDKEIMICKRIHWSVSYYTRYYGSTTIINHSDVASANEAIEKISDFLLANFNSFKAHLRERKINEIFAD